ncbi:3-dehydroquinate synthase, partial [Alphaproteobacteria bacterium]|nr:3-dehydroquinate synthase [Alphaproteobacteria bacterium]
DSYFSLQETKNKDFYKFVESIKEYCSNVYLLGIPGGDKTKNIIHLNELIENILTFEIDRESLIIAFGGGVVGDIAGFVSAIILRGINFIQVPTTLLSQVDSSIGGKTGINSKIGKNLIGAFHQPLAVISDMNVLKSLPKREFHAGLAEVIKYGLIKDISFFEWLEKEYKDILTLHQLKLQNIVTKSCEIKAEIIKNDEKEKGERALLNLGHTFAHAIEYFGNHDGRIIHGEAVSIGICLAFKLSYFLGFCKEKDLRRVANLFEKFNLPTSLRNFKNLSLSSTELIERFKFDKKNKQNQLTFILNKGIGKSFIHDNVNINDLTQFLDKEI